MIQLRSGTYTARLAWASFCICKLQSETPGVSPTIVNQMERFPCIHFERAIIQITTRARIWEQDAIFCWMGNFWLQRDEPSFGSSWGSAYLHLLPLLLECWAWSSCRTTPSANWRHRNEIARLLDQGNNCWGLFNTKLTSSSNNNIPQFPFCLSIHISVSLLRNAEASPWQNFQLSTVTKLFLGSLCATF